MSTIVTTINDAILARLVIALPTFSQIAILYDLAKNKDKALRNRFGSRPLGGVQSIEGNLGSYTVDQDFEITLTDSYKSSKLLNDNAQATTVLDLQDAVHDSYKEIKLLAPSGLIRQIFSLSISEPEIDTANHVVIQTFTITVKFQNSLK